MLKPFFHSTGQLLTAKTLTAKPGFVNLSAPFCIVVFLGTCTSAASDVPPEMDSGVRQYFKQMNPDELQLLKQRLTGLNEDIAIHGILKFPGSNDMLLTGYSSKEFYDWDLYFENLYLSYYGIDDYCFSNFKLFLARQQPDGFISRTLKSPRKTQEFKPFLAQIAVLGSKQRGDDYSWLKDSYYSGLQRYLDRWFKYDNDHNGLPVWNSADASGMDNQISRAGKKGSFQDEGVDLACYLHRELEAMAFIAGKLGKLDDQQTYQRKADALAVLINTVFWDDQDGFFYDRNEKTGKLTKVKSVAGFTPLWTGVATPDHAKRLIQEHLLNPKEFWLKYPVATYAATEPDFYEGRHAVECNWHGTAWIPTNYMIFHGLLHYGFTAEAKDLADRTFDMALHQNPVTREYYDSDTGHGNGLEPFWGWSSLAYVMPLEFAVKYDPTDFKAPIYPLISESLAMPGPKPE